MKKHVAIAAALTLSAAGLLAGCSNSSKKAETPAATEAAAKATEAATEAAETEAVEIEAVTEAAENEAVTEAAEIETVTEAVQEAASNEAADAAEETTLVVVATSGVSNPFSYQNDGVLTGYDVEVIKAIFEGLPQYELEIQVTEFEGILNGLDNGRYQLGVNNFSSNAERREKYDFSLPILENANVFVVRKDDETLKSLDDLGGYKAVTEVGNSGATLLENYNKENPDNPAEIIYTEENFITQFQGIEDGKYDVRIISRVSAERGIQEHGYENLKVVPFATEDSDPGSYILVSKSSDQELLAAVNDRIRELYEDGTLAKISEEQLGGDFTPAAELLAE